MNQSKQGKIRRLTGWRRSIRNAVFFVVQIVQRRLICLFKRHDSAFGDTGSKLHFYSVPRRMTRTVHVCKRCGAIYSKPKIGDDPARGSKLRDIF